MPQLSGVDLAIQVKAYVPDCKILLFSGQAAMAHLLEQTQARWHNFTWLSKPVHPADLLNEIERLEETSLWPSETPIHETATWTGKSLTRCRR